MLSFHKLPAQSDSTQNNAYYFDDGGVSEAKNLIKLNILSIINGDLPVYYERVLSKSFSIEIGAGILFPYYIPELPQLSSDSHRIENPDYGYSLWIHPKYYLQDQAPELTYFGIQLRRRNYNQDNETIIYTDVTLNYGLQLYFGKRFVFDYNIGIGFRFETDKAIDIRYNTSGLAVPIGIKLGVIL